MLRRASPSRPWPTPARVKKLETPTARPPDPGEDFKARLIEGSPDCMKVLDLDGRLLSMNAGGMKVLEICDLKPFVGLSWIDFWKGADRAAAEAAIRAAREGGIGRFVGFFPTTQTRTPMWFDVLVSAIVDASGKPEKLLAASREVTAWKRSEQMLHAIIEGTASVAGREFLRLAGQASRGGIGRSLFLRRGMSPESSRAVARLLERRGARSGL